MNIKICDKNYIGNHVYNYLREYLFNHACTFTGTFYVELSSKPNLICHSNEIIWKPNENICQSNEIIYQSRKITFPTPYGQYYGFYDNNSLRIEPKTIFILNLCECVLKMILGEPYEELLESYLEDSHGSKRTDKDRLNEHSLIIPARGGMNDNYVMWCYAVHHNGFLLVNPKYSGRKGSKHLECGQSNTNLLKFPFERLLTNVKPSIRNPYCLWGRMLSQEKNHVKLHYKTFLRPIAKTIDPKNFDKSWAMIGIRWFYVKYTGNSFCILHDRIDSLRDFIKSHEKIVLMFDKYEFTRLFFMMFYDVLRGKHLALLNRFGINGVENTLAVASKCGDFWHTYSGFYNIIENMNKNN